MNKSFKYTCLFGGGAIRGVSYIGAVKALEEFGIAPTTLAGSSVGSIIAALLAVGYNSAELKEIFLKVNFDLFRDISLGLGTVFALSKGEVFLDWLRDLIESKFYGEKYKKGANRSVTFKDIDKNLVIITTNLSNFECKEFSRYETPDFEIASAIRISCCMPGLMKPIEYNKTILVDGDLQKSWPMWKLSKNLLLNDERILEFRLEGYYDDNNNNLSGLDYANAVYSCMTAMSTSFITNIYAGKDKFDYIVLNTGDVVVVDFNISAGKRNELMKIGYDQTMEYFKKSLPGKKSKIKDNYKVILNHLTKINKLISANNILRAKMQLGDLFTDLCDLHNIIDLTDYEDLKSFKNLFLQNIIYPPLFGKAKINNDRFIRTELSRMIKNISAKVSELENYLELYPAK